MNLRFAIFDIGLEEACAASRVCSSNQIITLLNPGPMASQARHESVSPKETSASRYVVPVEGRGGLRRAAPAFGLVTRCSR
jgi:hypothetical protein